MKRIILAALILFTSNAFAQTWVQVPDANFQNYLTANYPAGAFMTSGSDFFVDSDHADIQNETVLTIPDLLIADITGINAFANLQELNCSSNQLMNLPANLPGSLLYLICDENPLSSLPDLPGSLIQLFCRSSNLTSLPDLPGTLTTLSCEYNQLTSLPDLSASLSYLNCNYNQLSALPTLPLGLALVSCSGNQLTVLPNLPSSLIELVSNYNLLAVLPDLTDSLKIIECHHNQIQELPVLPQSLERLECGTNLLTELPDLPNGLLILDCYNNQISIMPDLPNALVMLSCGINELTTLPALPSSLNTLGCYSNSLTELPDLPSALINLDFSDNLISTLPDLPITLNTLACSANMLSSIPDLPESLQYLYSGSNQINCFPEFPSSLVYLDISGNLFTCLPNYVSAMDVTTLAYPLCFANDPVNNPNGCESASGIHGSVFDDVNSDCVDSGLPIIYIPMNLNDDNGALLRSSTNLVNGDYYFAAGPGDYGVEVNTITLSPAVQVNCPVANELTATVTTANPVVNAGDFGLACAGFDLGVQSVVPTGWFFPGQTHSLNILAGDLTAQYNMHCATGISGDVTISVAGPGSVTFGGTPTSVSGNTATYSLSDFGALGANLFSASILTDSTANAGNEFCVSVTVTTAASGDLNPANNTYNFCYHVVNSYDPNIKLTTPELVDPGYTDEFTYTIYFQNTGNAPAFNIRLADTLDSNLDLTTLKFVNGSHAFTTTLSADSRLLSIRFPNIMLPDSTTDAEGSIGFIQYRAKPVSGLPNGTIIRNTGYIYFDFNAPIVTNTSENWFSSVGLNEVAESNLKVYPNPAITTVVFESNEVIEQLEFYNLNGTKVKTLQPKVQKTQVDVSSLQNGVYIVKVYSETGVANKRLVVSQ